jgi:RHS repeat-associated protein
LTDATGAVVDTYLYTAYGAPVASSGTDTNPFRYGGQFGYYTETMTGLVLCGARWYDPQMGRWLSRDPIGYAGGPNLYEYCDGDPVSFADPGGTDIRGFSCHRVGFSWNHGASDLRILWRARGATRVAAASAQPARRRGPRTRAGGGYSSGPGIRALAGAIAAAAAFEASEATIEAELLKMFASKAYDAASYNCFRAAVKAANILGRNGHAVTIIGLNDAAGAPDMIPDSCPGIMYGGPINQNREYVHYAVVQDGLFYDAVTHGRGVSQSEYQSLWMYPARWDVLSEADVSRIKRTYRMRGR